MDEFEQKKVDVTNFCVFTKLSFWMEPKLVCRACVSARRIKLFFVVLVTLKRKRKEEKRVKEQRVKWK